MTLRNVGFVLSASFALAACGQTGSDPSVTTAPAAASNAPVVATPAQTAAAPSYQQDTAEPADKIAAPSDDALAQCANLDTAQRDACELQARQGLEIQTQGVIDPSPASPTPPTDRVPAEATVQEEDDGE